MRGNKCFSPILTGMTSNLRFRLKLSSRGFKLTQTFDFGPKICNFTIHYSRSSVYVNSVTFSILAGTILNFTFRFLMPNYKVTLLEFQNLALRLHFYK